MADTASPISPSCYLPHFSTAAPATDAEYIQELWTAVRAMSTGSRQTRSQKGKKKATNDEDVNAGEIPVSAPSTVMPTPSTTETFETAETASAISKTTSRSKRKKLNTMPGPRDVLFESVVMAPHHIAVNPIKTVSSGAHKYFGTVCDTGTDSDSDGDGDTVIDTDYKRLEGLDHIKIWVDASEANCEEITAEYKEMVRQRLVEAEFATFAKEELLKGVRRADPIRKDEQFRIQRMVNPSLPVNDPSHWRKPPCLDEADNEVHNWRWDVRPDCSYWISLRGFNEKWQSEVQNITYVKGNITCPYFTIEFKRDDDEEKTGAVTPAMKQVAAAGSIALYNRFLLWRRALADNDVVEARKAKRPGKAKGQSWSPTPIDEVRHFGMTLAGSSYTAWVLKPQCNEGEWVGCTMERLQTGDCSSLAADTEKLIHWINEIHRWGLTVHGPACKREIKICLRAAKVRTSDLFDGGERADG